MANAIDYPRVLFVERQTPRGWPLWLALVPIVVTGAAAVYFALFKGGAGQFTRSLAFTLILIAPALILMQRLVVSVTSHELAITYSIFRRLRFNLSDIAEAVASDYEPIREFGGWGIKWSLRDSTTAYTMHGTRGVRVVTTGGKKILIGSQRADELADAINRAKRPPLD